jgi:hypothetical protein
MQQRRGAALKGVDPDRGRRTRQNNIVTARNNAREERLSHRRRVTGDPDAQAIVSASNSTNDPRMSLADLQKNVRLSKKR